MKNILIRNILPILLLGLLTSCIKDDDFHTPDLNVPEIEIKGEVIDIDALYGLWLQELENSGNQTLTFHDSADLFICGYVISSDEGGNFFEELVIQNTASSPTRGVKILLDVNPLYAIYEFGRKIFVRLDGLTVGLDSGVLSLGLNNANSIDKISESALDQLIIRDPEVAEILPLPMNISGFTADKTNLFIRLGDVQFNRTEVLGAHRKTFAADPMDEFDGERQLESCAEDVVAIFSTSTFSDFKAVLLPQGRGTLDAILTMDFFGQAFNLVVNDPGSINFDNETRCDPDIYHCDEPSGGGDVFYQENFELFNSMEDYVSTGWTNVNVSEGATVYDIGNFSNNNYAQITGFNAGEDLIESWLISPGLDLDATTAEDLSFDVQANFDNGNILTVWFSTNYAEDIDTATWLQLDANIPIGPEDGFGDFQTVGPINIACIEGTAHFAFVYKGGDPGATTRYHIDNIRIGGK